MSTSTTTQTVGEIAARYPQAPRVFERYGIDYCCGGKLPLAQVCAERGLAPERVLDEVSSSTGEPGEQDWAAAPLSGLIAHIVTKHHEYLKTELPRISGLLAKVVAAHGANHGDFLLPLDRTFQALHDELDAHLAKEEMVLFPLIRRMEEASLAGSAPAPAHCGSVNNPIRVMEHEHDSAGDALAQMRSLTSGYAAPADACNTFRALYWALIELEADLHRHIHLENNVLFPRAAALEASFE